ncbi:MAG: SDR family oxidoreductase, partial [Acidobacteriota bacterium]
LALEHKMLPASLHYQQANTQIDFANSPFYVNSQLRVWPDNGKNGKPRRAGVSSFGVGGTNAHVIVEEWRSSESSSRSREWQVLLLSGKSETALTAATKQLGEYLQQHREVNLADVAYTLQLGRKHFNYRRAVICQDHTDAIDALESLDPRRVFTLSQESGSRSVVFMFPGGGAQYVNMGLGLYQSEDLFREQIDLSAELLKQQLGYDIRELIYPSKDRFEEANERLKQTSVALPALFAVEYAMARLWMSWGIKPSAMIGHSLGEYTAACIAGVFSLQDALSLVVLRGQLFEQLPKGGMLSVPLTEQEIKELIGGNLSIAAINGSNQSVISGPVEAIERVATLLSKRDVEFRRLQIDVAAHSEMVTGILDKFGKFIQTLKLNEPTIPYISNVTGTWISSEQATDPTYWTKHLRQTVRFADGITELLKEPSRVLLEVGPGHSLSMLAKLQTDIKHGQAIITSIKHPYEKQTDQAYLLTAIAKLWLAGIQIDWVQFYDQEYRHRLPLPTYPFERQRYWIAPQKKIGSINNQIKLNKKPDIADWFYIPGWRSSLPATTWKISDIAEDKRYWLILADEIGIAPALARRLESLGQYVVIASAGECFAKLEDTLYTLDLKLKESYQLLLRDLRASSRWPTTIVHLSSIIDNNQQKSGVEFFKKCQDRGFYSLLFLAQALSDENITDNIQLCVVSNNVQQIESSDLVCVEKATLLGPCKVIPQENDKITCRFIDLVIPKLNQFEKMIEQLVIEISSSSLEPVVAYRGNQRWIQSFEAIRLESEVKRVAPLRERGVYLIVGGLGRIGLLLAECIAHSKQARLILTSHSGFLAKDKWQEWLVNHEETDPLSIKIRKLQALEQCGTEILILKADVTAIDQMQQVIDEVIKRFGELAGVIYAAGVAGEKTVNLIQEINRRECEIHFHAKVYGLYVLEQVLQNRSLDFCLLISSNTSVLGGLGSLSYTSANLFMDAFAINRSRDIGSYWISTNWDGWLLEEESRLSQSFQTSIDKYAMTPVESTEAFQRVLSIVNSGQVIVSTGDLVSRLKLWIGRSSAKDLQETAGSDSLPILHPRPTLTSAYIPPTNELEKTITSIWQELLGIEQLGVHDNFFELGGNSLIGLKVISRLKAALSVDIPVSSLFEGPTVSALAKVIGRDENEKPFFEKSQSRGERRREKRLKRQA